MELNSELDLAEFLLCRCDLMFDYSNGHIGLSQRFIIDIDSDRNRPFIRTMNIEIRGMSRELRDSVIHVSRPILFTTGIMSHFLNV